MTTGGSAARVHGDISVAGKNPWTQYFGPTNTPMATNAYERYSEQNYDLPEAYRGKNIYLRDTLNDLITGEGRTAFYTSSLLPWEQTDQISFAWNEFHFNEQLAGRVPHEGVSRLVTSSKRSRQDKSVRRGLAMVLEHGFMGTPDGMEMYRRNMIGIAQSVQETANHDVLSAILSTEVYDKQWESQHGVVTTGLERTVEDEVYRYAAVQKQKNGLDLLVEDVKKKMGRYGVVADTLICPPKLSVYMNMVRPEKTDYYLGGQLATQNIRKGGSLMSFRSLSVFETRSFDVYNGEPPIDLTLRPRQVGEYYVLGSKDKGIEIYDEQVDDWVYFSKIELMHKLNKQKNSMFGFNYQSAKDFDDGWQGRKEAVFEGWRNRKYGAQDTRDFYSTEPSGETGMYKGGDYPTNAGGGFFPNRTDEHNREREAAELGSFGASFQSDVGMGAANTGDTLLRAVMASALQQHRSVLVSMPAAAQRTASAVLKTLVESGWSTSTDHEGGHFCEHGVPSYSLVSGNSKGFSAQDVPIQYTQVNIVDGAVHHSFSRSLADMVVTSVMSRGGCSYMPNQTVSGASARRAVVHRADELCETLTQACGNTAELQKDLVSLFSLSAQTTEFQQCFAGNSGSASDARVEATADGWTGHCGLHMSYAGLKLICAHGSPLQVEAAARWTNAVDAACSVLAAQQLPAVTAFIASSLPANYFCTAGGGANSRSTTSTDATKTWLFSVMSNTRFGHSLLPVAISGTVAHAHKALRGDTILCPAYALSAFCASQKGIVGGLALVNSSIGLSGVTAPNQVPEVNAARWQLGTPLPGSPILSMLGQSRSGSKRSLEGTGSSSRKKRGGGSGGGSVMQLNTDRVHWGVKDMIQPRSTAVLRTGASAVALAATLLGTGLVGAKVDPARAKKFGAGGPRSALRPDEVAEYEAEGGDKGKKFGDATDYSIAEVDGALVVADASDILLFRPFIEHQMHSVIMMKAGAETGKTYYGHNNVTVGDDAIRKMHYVNLTFYSKAVVKESKNISVIEDVYMAGYNGGNNAEFFSDVHDSNQKEKRVDKMNYSTAAGRKGPSILLGTHQSGGKAIPNPCNITGKHSSSYDPTPEAHSLHFTGAAAMVHTYGLQNLAKYDKQQNPGAMGKMYFEHSRPVNTTCFRGAHYLHRRTGRKYMPNTGHLGPTYPGVKAVRSGQNKHMLSEHELSLSKSLSK